VGVPGNATSAAVTIPCGSADGTFQVTRPDVGALTVPSTSTSGSTVPSGAVPASADPQLSIPTAGISAKLVPASLSGTDVTVPADPSLVGQLDAGAGAGDPLGTMILAGRASDTHSSPGSLAGLASVTPGAAVTVKDVWGKTRKFTVATVQVLPRTLPLPASLFAQSGPLGLVILSAGDPVHYGPGGSLVTYRSHVVVTAT
jgi:hypothetical protein